MTYFKSMQSVLPTYKRNENNDYLKFVSNVIKQEEQEMVNCSEGVSAIIEKSLKILRSMTPFAIMMCVICGFHFTNFVFFKYYPPIANFTFFSIFFISLFRKRTAIQKIASVIEGELNNKMLLYTRKLSYIWVCFTFINFIISLWTVFLSKEIWTIYNGCISYMMVGLLFGTECIVRKNYKKKHNI